MTAEISLNIGVAALDITPPPGVTLSGYTPRTAAALGHRLRAEALVCRGARGGWAWITADVIGFPRPLTAAIRRAVRASVGLPPAAVMVAATHTHSGPATIWFGGGAPSKTDRAYLEALPEQLGRLARFAWESASPGRFEAASIAVPELGSNRRIQAADGTWTNEWQDEEGRHPGFFDPTLLLVGVRRPDGVLDALVVNYGVHPVVLGPGSLEISADYVGYLKDAIEVSGSARTVLFTLAGAGNINPRHCIQVGAEHPRRVGEALAERVRTALPLLAPLAPGAPRRRRAAWNFPRTQDTMPGKGSRPMKVGERVRTEIQALRAGDFAVIGIPGEVFSEFNSILRAASPARATVIASVANGYIGYLPTNAAMAEGAYEARMSPASNVETVLREAVDRSFAAIGSER